MLKDGPRIPVRQRRGRNLRQLRRLLRRKTLGIGQRRDGGNARRGRIAGELEHVANRSALHASIGSPGALWIFVAAAPTVVGRIGVDDQTSGAVLLRDKCFHSAEVLPVPYHYDLAAYIYP